MSKIKNNTEEPKKRNKPFRINATPEKVMSVLFKRKKKKAAKAK